MSIKRAVLNANALSAVLLAVTFGYILFITILNISNPILDAYGFRQTQTAITSFYFIEGGFKLNYETPVVGYPWNIPFEFPLFQAIVALTKISLKNLLTLTEIGRLWGLIFTLLCALSIIKILEILKIPKSVRFLTAALFLSTPLYLFYAGTFLIESAALFFTLMYLYFTIRLADGFDWRYTHLVPIAFFLTLGLLQKITTIFPALLITPLIFLAFYNKNKYKVYFRDLNFYIKIIIGFIIPILIGVIWVKYSDYSKAQNIIGFELTSSSLRSWNFGDLSQRLSQKLWVETIYSRNIGSISFGFLGVITILFGLIFSSKAEKLLIIFCLFLFLVPFLIFTNLHIVHDYYQYANLIYYLIALSISCYVISRVISIRYSIILYIIIGSSLIFFNYFSFYHHYYHRKSIKINESNNKVLMLAARIKDSTPKEMPIIIYGLDWSSELPFYSERRALALPPWAKRDFQALENIKVFLGNSKPSAVVLCPTQDGEILSKKIIKSFHVSATDMVEDCFIFHLVWN